MAQLKSIGNSLGKVLVVGGCGFLGSHVVEQLLQEWDTTEIAVLDIQTEKNRFDGVSYFKGDIASKDLVQTTMQSFQPLVIMHCASPIATKGTRQTFQSGNITGTRNLLKCAVDCGTVRAFVFCSSSGVVHDTYSDLIDADESWPLIRPPHQPDPYLETKIVAEEMILAANGKNDIYTTAIRPAVIFGERDGVLIPTVVERAKEGKFKIQIGNGLNIFDFTYAGNVAHSLLLAAEHLLHKTSSVSDSEKVDGEAFFVTNDQRYPFWEFNRMISREADYPIAQKDIRVLSVWLMLAIASFTEVLYWIFTFGTKKPKVSRQTFKTTTINRTFKIDKIKKRLGYVPRVSLEDGLHRAVKWYQETQAQRNNRTKR